MRAPARWSSDLPVLLAHWRAELALQQELLELSELSAAVYPEVLEMQRAGVRALATCVAALDRRQAQPPSASSS